MPADDPPDIKSSNIIASLIEHWRRNRQQTHYLYTSGGITPAGSLGTQVIRPAGIPSEEVVGSPRIVTPPDILLQAAILDFGDKTNEGYLVRAVSIPWFEIIRELARDPGFLSKVPWRKLEEIIAGAYQREGWPEVILTPRSRDGGRDVIATKPGIGSIRIIDQVKAYKPGHRVTADEVRAVLGVLSADQNVSKGVITTSSEFAPGIEQDLNLRAFMPYRLELKDGEALRRWLMELSSPTNSSK